MDDMRELLSVISASMWLVAFMGCVAVSHGFVGWYMAARGDVAPGQALWVDDLAPDPMDAILQAVLGTVLIIIALGVRAAIRRKLRL